MRGLFKTEEPTTKKRHRNNVRISFSNADKARLLHIFKEVSEYYLARVHTTIDCETEQEIFQNSIDAFTCLKLLQILNHLYKMIKFLK